MPAQHTSPGVLCVPTASPQSVRLVRDGGEIIADAPASLFFCLGRLSGRYDAAKRQWRFPARRSVLRGLLAALPVENADYWRSLISVDDKPDSANSQATFGSNQIPNLLNHKEPATVDAKIAPVAKFATPLGNLQAIPIVKTEPWKHQVAAFWFTQKRFKQSRRRGILLALDMGCGKSKVAIDLLQNYREYAPQPLKRVLIVCPARVIQVWPTQFSRHANDNAFLLLPLTSRSGTVSQKVAKATEKLDLAATRKQPAVVIVNYESAWREEFAGWALRQLWDVVILDESHRIKAPGGKASQFFKRLSKVARYRLALTGTPMPHSPLDVYAQFRFLDSTIFGTSFGAFRQMYATMGGFQGKEVLGFRHMDDLQARMREVTFRVTREEVLQLIPPTTTNYECMLSPSARATYNTFEKDFIVGVKSGIITASNALVVLLRLQQMTGGWARLDDGRDERIDDSKARLLADVLSDLAADEPVVVFCWFQNDLDTVHQVFADLGRKSLELSGRHDDLQRWQAGEAPGLAVQIAAGGEGVDLTRARIAVFYSIGFFLAKYEQAKARLHRPGQERGVNYIHLAAASSIDIRVMRALEKRADLVGAILAEVGGEA